MSECQLCKLMIGLVHDESVDREQARAVFLCGVATGEFLAWRGTVDLCESCTDTVAQARGAIQRALCR
jgi:hypothetical protein